MARTSRLFVSETGLYTGGYTSQIIEPEKKEIGMEQFHFTRGIIQVEITTGTVHLHLRLHPDAPWLEVKTFTESAMYELVLAHFIRIIASDSARCWLGEIR